MPDPKPDRPKAPEFTEGKESAARFFTALKTVLSVPKEKVLELEKQSKKTPKPA